MQSVRVSKSELLDKLRANLEQHLAEYDEAVSKYPAVVVEELRKRADAIEAGEEVNLVFNLPKPQSFETEYVDAIEMLEWSEDKVVELEHHEFKQYVQNEWAWQRQFAASTSFYNAR